DRRALSHCDPSPARRATPGAAASAEHRAARRGDPHPADVGRSHRRGDRSRHRGRPRLLWSTVMSAPMRILQLYPKSDFYTGAAIQLLELAQGLRERGHEVVVATRPSEAWAARLRELGMTHYALPMSSEIDLRSAARLVGILRRHRIQIVHAQKGKAR